MSNLLCFVDHEYTNIQRDMPRELFELGICDKRGHSIRFKLVGIVIVENYIFSILPKGSNVPKTILGQQDLTRLVLGTLIKYNRSSQEGHLFKSGPNNNVEPLDSIQRLVQDYLHHGIVQFQKRRKDINGRGKIHWPKTIQQTPYIFGGQPYYLDLVTNKIDSASQNEISHIHRFVMQNISMQYGWIFNFKKDFNSIESKFKQSQMIYFLKKALNETYVDREIQLFKCLICYLEGTSDNEKLNISLYATEHFHSVWEKMCSVIMSYNYEVQGQDQMPNPYWSVNHKIFRTNQIPDILVKKNNTWFVFDAKYYNVNRRLDKLPGWGDIVKQLFYAKSIHEIIQGEEKKVYNAFLFPAYGEGNTRYHGFASVEGLEGSSHFGKIHSYELDIISIMNQYLRAKDNGIFEWIIDDLMMKENADK